MHPATTVDFASAARTLTREARRRNLVGPSFRCPPRLVGVDRTIRRRADGAVVSVRLRGRPVAAVLADMIEGVVATNRLRPPDADRLRAELWQVLGSEATNTTTPGTMTPGTMTPGAMTPGTPTRHAAPVVHRVA